MVITRRPWSTLCEIRAGTTAQASISDGFSLHGAMILHDLYARGLVQPLLAHEKSSALSRRDCVFCLPTSATSSFRRNNFHLMRCRLESSWAGAFWASP